MFTGCFRVFVPKKREIEISTNYLKLLILLTFEAKIKHRNIALARYRLAIPLRFAFVIYIEIFS